MRPRRDLGQAARGILRVVRLLPPIIGHEPVEVPTLAPENWNELMAHERGPVVFVDRPERVQAITAAQVSAGLDLLRRCDEAIGRGEIAEAARLMRASEAMLERVTGDGSGAPSRIGPAAEAWRRRRA